MENNKDIYDPFSIYDSSNEIHPTAVIYHENVIMGKNNKIGAYAVIGSNGEIRNCKSFGGRVEIGDGNTISELVTIQRPAKHGALTKVGDNNLIMAHSHLGHDVTIGNDCEICTGTILGGYVTVKNGAKIKLGSTIRNRKTIGEKSIVGMGAIVVKDVIKNQTVVGNPAKPLMK